MHKKNVGMKFHRIKSCVGSKVQWILDQIFCRQLSFRWQLIELLLIKYLYMFLAVLVLDYKWYQGYGSYGITFTFLNEIFASVVFVAVCVLYLKLFFPEGFLKQLVQCLFIMYYIPLNSAFSINDTSWGFFFLSNVYFVLILIATWWISLQAETKWSRFMPRQEKLAQAQYHNRRINVLCFLVCCIFIMHKLAYNGLELSLSIVDGVYSTRATYQEYLSEISGTLFSYLLALVRYLVTYMVPFYLFSALLRKKPAAIVICVLCILSMYSVSAEKSKLLMPVAVVLLYILYRMDLLKHFDRVFSCGIIFLMIFCLAEHVLLGTDRIYTLIIRREMYTPAWLNTIYYDFFSQNDKICWTQSVILLQNIFKPIYEVSPLNLINNTYFQGLVPSPNTGMFAEAYMHFGVMGVVIYPVLFATFFVLSNRVLNSYGHPIQMLLAFQVTMSLTNIPLTRTDFVLSYVLLVAILYTLPRVNINKSWKYIKRA